MKQKNKQIFSISITVIFILNLFFISCFSENKTNFNKANITIISKYGKHEKYPACSISAIKAAKNDGADGIFLNVFKTIDNILVAAPSDELSDFTDTTGKITNKNFDEIKNIKLKNGNYKSFEKTSEDNIIPFSELIEKTKNLNLTFYIDIIYENIIFLKELNYKNIVILNSKNDNRIEALHKELVIASVKPYNTSVIYFIKSKKAFSSTIFIGGKNPYGPAFSKKSLNDKNIAYGIDMTVPEKCGKRRDETLSFDNIISKGYSIIVTDNIGALKAYKERSKKASDELLNEIISAENKFKIKEKSKTYRLLKTSILKAKHAYINSNCISELEFAKTELKKAEKIFSENPDGKTTTLTPIRITGAVGISILFIIIEIAFYKVRKWSDSRRIKEIED